MFIFLLIYSFFVKWPQLAATVFVSSIFRVRSFFSLKQVQTCFRQPSFSAVITTAQLKVQFHKINDRIVQLHDGFIESLR